MTKGRGPRRRASCRFRDEAKRKPEDRHPFRDIEGFSPTHGRCRRPIQNHQRVSASLRTGSRTGRSHCVRATFRDDAGGCRLRAGSSTFVILGQAQQSGARPEDPCRNVAAVRPRCRTRPVLHLRHAATFSQAWIPGSTPRCARFRPGMTKAKRAPPPLSSLGKIAHLGGAILVTVVRNPQKFRYSLSSPLFLYQ
jgi:hypothetical protein